MQRRYSAPVLKFGASGICRQHIEVLRVVHIQFRQFGQNTLEVAFSNKVHQSAVRKGTRIACLSADDVAAATTDICACSRAGSQSGHTSIFIGSNRIDAAVIIGTCGVVVFADRGQIFRAA
jgi:hypothetical protein